MKLTVDVNQQERQCCKSLLSINDKLFSVLVADDDGAKEVVTIPLDGGALVRLFVALKELVGEVVDQLRHLLGLSLILPLIVIYGVFCAA